MKNKALSYVFTVVGLAALIAGLCLIKVLDAPNGLLKALPYVLVGVGCGAFGHGVGDIISRATAKNSPEVQKKMEIELNDERNVAIVNRSKAKAYDIMIPVFGALEVAFALMNVAVEAVLLLVAAYLFVCGCGIYYRCKYSKEM